jgi:acyl-coenzyme A synthetase/AMP-(fatty) acid ligase
VVDPKTFRAVPRGQPGVILARTKARCLGYLGEQERWDEKVDGPWFNTGDIGIVTWSGNVVFLDREVDEIPGMSCVEIEDVIDDRLPEVLECVVLGTPGRPPLPIVITADGRLDPAAWRDAVRDLPPLDEPMVVTWDQIPRTGTGKVRRLELREQLAGVGITHGTGRWT